MYTWYHSHKINIACVYHKFPQHVLIELEHDLLDHRIYSHLERARNRTPSPSVIAIVWERPVLPSKLIALRSSGIGMPVSNDSTGGSVIS